MEREHLQDADVIGNHEPDGRGVCSPGFSGRYQPLGLNPLTPSCLRAVCLQDATILTSLACR
jgi:hypothetical protein